MRFEQGITQHTGYLRYSTNYTPIVVYRIQLSRGLAKGAQMQQTMAIKRWRRYLLLPLLSSCLFTAACDPVSLTVLGVGASTGVGYGLDSIAYKTFTAPMKKVNKAARKALKRMGIAVASVERTKDAHVITAKSGDRVIELTIEKVSNKATRIRSIARLNTIFFDRATANEVIVQTERAMRGV